MVDLTPLVEVLASKLEEHTLFETVMLLAFLQLINPKSRLIANISEIPLTVCRQWCDRKIKRDPKA